jgi:hypothetical protein
MCLEILGAVVGIAQVQASSSVCGANELLLGGMAWHGDTGGSPVLINPSLPNDTLDMVAISQRLGKCLQNNTRYAFATSVAVGISVPHSTTTVW